jgi:hypothetical protein
MARYLANRGTTSTILQFRNKPCLHDRWVDYAQSLLQLNQDLRRFQGITITLEHALQSRTYLVEQSLRFADVALFDGALGFPSHSNPRRDMASYHRISHANFFFLIHTL